MKKLTLILPLFFVLCTAFGQIPSRCVPTELREAYESDVYKLANQVVSLASSPYKDSIRIPLFIEDSIWSGLGAIYNAYELADRDSVFDVYCIHEESCSGLPVPYLTIATDTSFSWTTHWENMETLTGIAPLDSFLVQYGYSLVHYEGGMADFTTSAHLNMTALLNTWADSLKKTEGITDMFYGDLACCHNQLFYSTTGDTSVFSFVMGWGDTHWDCNNTRTWTFAVHHCLVEMISKTTIMKVPGPIPDFRKPNCKITSGVRLLPDASSDMFIITPNPAHDYVRISTSTPGTFQVVMYNMLGHRMYQGTSSDQTTLSLSHLQKGMYFVQILCQDGKGYGYRLVLK